MQVLCAGMRSTRSPSDLRATALAAIAAALAFGLHRSLIEVVVAMAALGVLVRLVLGA